MNELLQEQRCPRCAALLFRADAEGDVEIKCRKCGRIVNRTLSRVTPRKSSVNASPTEGQSQYESPERPLAEARGNELGR